jgi:Rrf2 family protein
MRLSEQSRYALRALAYCAENHPRQVKVAEISQATGISEQNIFKLVKALTKIGFMTTVRGPHGGVRLSVPPEAIRVGQVIRAMEPRFQACGPLDLILSEAPISPVEQALDGAIGRGIAAFMETLDQTSVATLIARDTHHTIAA